MAEVSHFCVGEVNESDANSGQTQCDSSCDASLQSSGSKGEGVSELGLSENLRIYEFCEFWFTECSSFHNPLEGERRFLNDLIYENSPNLFSSSCVSDGVRFVFIFFGSCLDFSEKNTLSLVLLLSRWGTTKGRVFPHRFSAKWGSVAGRNFRTFTHFHRIQD